MRKLVALMTFLFFFGSHAFSHENSKNFEAVQATSNPALKIQGIECYLDLGILSSQLWGFMIWWPESYLDVNKYNEYINALLLELKKAGINQIYLSFAQISSINALVNEGKGGSSQDVIAQMMKDFPGALQELVKQAHVFGMKVTLSFGGENGTAMQICARGETPVGQAQKLAHFVKSYTIDAVDFDIENASFIAVNPVQTAREFFKSLKQLLNARNKKVILTIPGGIYDWPLRYLKDIFFDANGHLILPNLFDRLNLMLYSQTQYYLDANHPTWGLEQWLDLLGNHNASMIHIGFEDAVNYASKAASAGGTYSLNTQNPGYAAAEIYLQILEQLEKDGYPTNFGAPFFWPDSNRHVPGTWSRYQVLMKNGNLTVNFDSGVMKYFYNRFTSKV